MQEASISTSMAEFQLLPGLDRRQRGNSHHSALCDSHQYPGRKCSSRKDVLIDGHNGSQVRDYCDSPKSECRLNDIALL